MSYYDDEESIHITILYKKKNFLDIHLCMCCTSTSSTVLLIYKFGGCLPITFTYHQFNIKKKNERICAL